MLGAALDDDLAGADGRLALVHQQHDLAGQHDAEVDRLGAMELLWHHAAHAVDLFQHQTQSPIVDAHAMQGPAHPELGIAMDMSIQLRTESGALCTLALSFNNDGPFGTFFRYIGDTGTYLAR